VTIPRLLEMETYWGTHPPIHDMLAAFFGIKGKGTAGADVIHADDAFDALTREFTASGGVIIDG
jgi:hypothetical protein